METQDFVQVTNIEDLKLYLKQIKYFKQERLDFEQSEYPDLHRAYREISGSTFEKYCAYLSEKVSEALHDQASDEVLNICSIGCGDGQADYKVLSKALGAFPKSRVNYFGIDISVASCQQAKKILTPLPCTVTIINKGILEIAAKSLPKFDIVIMAHVHYPFYKDLKPLFCKAMEICKANGRLEVIAGVETPIWRLCEAFDYNICFAHVLLKELDKMGLMYTTRALPGKADFSRCVMDNFTSPLSHSVLNFFSQANLNAYPPLVTLLSASYIKSCLDERHCCDCAGLAITLPWASMH
jgi:2-polyprenyl-3-methyl-5-hydroxy-6-metoxy-1,4-benzoquinol methylase